MKIHPGDGMAYLDFYFIITGHEIGLRDEKGVECFFFFDAAHIIRNGGRVPCIQYQTGIVG